ncbi:MAG: B12-binding domain-containing radical SAM protein [Elusimicrobiota bacterium]
MKIALVIPPSPYMTEDTAFPTLGILYVASSLEKKGYKPLVCDLTGEKRYYSRYIDFIKKYKPDIIGFTATTPDMPFVIKLFQATKKISPKILTLIGGHHATILPHSLHMFDRVISGEGFEAIFDAINGVKKYIIQENLTDLNNIPLPARHLINLNKYKYFINGKLAANIISHLGCPYRCVFCCGRNNKYYTTLRFRKPENVIEEMDFLNKKYGYEAFMFYDDEFNIDKNYSLALCELLTKRNYIWRAPMRANLLDDDLMKAFKRAGCYEITVGVESASTKVLDIANKKTTVEINTNAYKLAKKYGIRFKAFIVVGLPGSTIDDEKMTEKWLEENPPDDIDVTPNTPYPSTPQYENPKKYRLKFNYDFFKNPISFKFNPKKIKVYCENSFLSKNQIIKIIKRFIKKFKKK